MDRFIQFAVAAADIAMKDAGLHRRPGDGGPRRRLHRQRDRRLRHHRARARSAAEGRARAASPPSSSPRRSSTSPRAGSRSGRAPRGRTPPPRTACTSGAHAVGDSFRLIQHGEADAMIAGGTEAAITPLGVGGFCAMRALSTRNDEPEKASRPFDKDRDGFVIGEGAGIVDPRGARARPRARARGSTPRSSGYGMSGDAYHISAPCEDGDGAVRVMRATLEDAGVEPSDVDYINVHGTSTPRGDAVETIAIKTVFGEHARSLALSSTKSMTGHLLGAAGGLEAGITALALRDQVASAHHQPREPGPGVRPRLRARTRRARPSCATPSATPSASAAPTARCSSSASRPEQRESPMKIVVCVKQVPDTETRVQDRALGRRHLRGGRGQLDRLALRRVRDRGGPADQGEAGAARSCSSRSGPSGPRPRCATGSRWAPTRRVHVKDAALDGADTPRHGAGARRRAAGLWRPFDLVLCGQQGVGGDNSQVPGMLAELLDLPQVTVAVKIEVADGKAHGRARDRGRQRDLGDVPPGRRLGPEGAQRAALREPQGDHGREEEDDPGARRSPPSASTRRPSAPKVTVKALELPPARPAVRMIDGDPQAQATELIRLLHEEAKVI